MTGTGGFLIEASLSGRNAIGIDVHSEMVQGARTNLAWAHDGTIPEHASVKRGRERDWPTPFPTIGLARSRFRPRPALRSKLPRQHGERPVAGGLLRSARDVAHPDRRVRAHPTRSSPTEHTTDALPLNHPLALLNGDWSDVLRLVESCSWAPQSVHVERVHKASVG